MQREQTETQSGQPHSTVYSGYTGAQVLALQGFLDDLWLSSADLSQV